MTKKPIEVVPEITEIVMDCEKAISAQRKAAPPGNIQLFSNYYIT